MRLDLTARSGLNMQLIYIIYAYCATVASDLPSNLRFYGACRGNGGQRCSTRIWGYFLRFKVWWPDLRCDRGCFGGQARCFRPLHGRVRL